jgi:predicted nucleic acid-binding OB-fold protein
MAKAITERQHKLTILKKFKESNKWKLISEDLKNKREAL